MIETTGVLKVHVNATTVAAPPTFLSEIVPILPSICWAFVFCVFCYWFRGDIAVLIRRIQEMKIFGNVLSSPLVMPESKSTEPKPRIDAVEKATAVMVEFAGQPPERYVLKSETVGNIYWLGSDVAMLLDCILRGGGRQEIIHMLRQCNHHTISVGFEGTFLQKRVQKLYQQATATLEAEWTNELRGKYARDAAELKTIIGKIIEHFQPDFQGFPNP